MAALITVKLLPWLIGLLGVVAIALGWRKALDNKSDAKAAKGRIETLKEVQGNNNASSALDDTSLVNRLSDKP